VGLRLEEVQEIRVVRRKAGHSFRRGKQKTLRVIEGIARDRAEAAVPHQLGIKRRVDHRGRPALIPRPGPARRGPTKSLFSTPIAIDRESPKPFSGEWQPAHELSPCRPTNSSKKSNRPRLALAGSRGRPSRCSRVLSTLPVNPWRGENRAQLLVDAVGSALRRGCSLRQSEHANRKEKSPAASEKLSRGHQLKTNENAFHGFFTRRDRGIG